MAHSITFILKEPKSSEPTLIYLIMRYNTYKVDNVGNRSYQRFKFSTGLKWIPKNWNIKKNEGIKKDNAPDPDELNQCIKNIENVASNIYRKLVNDKVDITFDVLRKELDKRTDIFPDLKRKATRASAVIEQPKTLLVFFEDFIKNLKYIYKGGQPYPVTNRTKQRYATTFRHLKDFAATQLKEPDFDTIDQNFYQNFVDYLRTKTLLRPTAKKPNPTQTLKMADNTVGKHISTLKTILNEATDKGINVNTKYRSTKFAVVSEDVAKIYLTEAELDKLYSIDLSKNPSLDRVRDLFLIGCYTCLRFADFTNIRPENFYTNDSGTFLRINTAKTGKLVVIPLHYKVLEILNKYDHRLPKSISNQKMNDYLKVLAKKAELDEQISIEKMKGGKKDTKTSYKYDLISSHTARRSGATNMFLSGIPSISIMRITGHKTEKAFMRYIQMSDEENAIKLMDNPFFKNSKK
ncbi:MAG: site-specific integrase [Bacteroidota bacterium]